MKGRTGPAGSTSASVTLLLVAGASSAYVTRFGSRDASIAAGFALVAELAAILITAGCDSETQHEQPNDPWSHGFFVPSLPVYGFTLPFVVQLFAFEPSGADRTWGAT